jgi:hypothetical protein
MGLMQTKLAILLHYINTDDILSMFVEMLALLIITIFSFVASILAICSSAGSLSRQHIVFRPSS